MAAVLPTSSKGDVSVLIPARNEERRIVPLLESLRSSRGGVREILVLDDGSDDCTVRLVEECTQHDARIRVIRGSPVPAGWLGKPWACEQLAREASGATLLFLDADVTIRPDGIERALEWKRRERADALTLFPEQMLGTLSKVLVIPLVDFVTRTTLPLALVPRTSSPSLSAGHGQFFMIDRSAYAAAGGQEAARDTTVEDVVLAQNVKRSGGRLAVGAGLRIVQCRMYENAREVACGLAKCAFAAANFRTLPYLAAVSALACVLLLPFFVWTGAGFAASVVLLALRGLHGRCFGYPVFLSVALHPLSAVACVGIALFSCICSTTGVITWKGRKIVVET
jgi:glycosyltransferase involved in cell wall biosynthesis